MLLEGAVCTVCQYFLTVIRCLCIECPLYLRDSGVEMVVNIMCPSSLYVTGINRLLSVIIHTNCMSGIIHIGSNFHSSWKMKPVMYQLGRLCVFIDTYAG
jgi:hypothetical protein